jgi:ferredoxin
MCHVAHLPLLWSRKLTLHRAAHGCRHLICNKGSGRFRHDAWRFTRAERTSDLMSQSSADGEPLRVWIDQELCTGDGLCVQYAPEVFEFDVDGLAYVKDREGQLLTSAGAATDVPVGLTEDVIESAKECPGTCIHVVRAVDGREIAGPEAE